MEGELEAQQDENKILRECIQTLEADVRKSQNNVYRRTVSQERFCSNDDIEALKLQVGFQDYTCLNCKTIISSPLELRTYDTQEIRQLLQNLYFEVFGSNKVKRLEHQMRFVICDLLNFSIIACGIPRGF